MNVVINKMMDAERALAFNVNKIPLANQPRLTDTTKLFIMGERPNCSNMFHVALEKWLDNNSKVFWLLRRGSTSGDAAFFMARHWCCTATWLTWKMRINLVIFQIIPDIFQNSLFAVRRVGVFHTFRNDPEKLA